MTGLIGTQEINCHDALNIVIQAMQSINGKYFNEIKLSKKDKVISLYGVNSKLKIGDQTGSCRSTFAVSKNLCYKEKAKRRVRIVL